MAMKIYSQSGRLSFKEFTFPDGQPHFELLHGSEFKDVTIETAIRSGHELLQVLLAKDALTSSGYIVSLDVRYLLGARMDRPINARQPFTLAVIARMLLQAGFRRIRVLDPHSSVTETLLGAEPVMPLDQLKGVLAKLPYNTLIIAPDAGATPRIRRLLAALGLSDTYRVVQCEKVREANSGRLSGFRVLDASVVDRHPCLIVDDLCDGGGTFVGLGAELRSAGALVVDLFVTHGIFSKGITLDMIRRIYTTNSYFNWSDDKAFICLPVDMAEMQSQEIEVESVRG